MPRTVPSYTIQNPTTGSVITLTFSRQSNGAGGFVTVCTAVYDLVDENGNVVVHNSLSLQLSAGQSSSLGTFITTNILPLIVTSNNL